MPCERERAPSEQVAVSALLKTHAWSGCTPRCASQWRSGSHCGWYAPAPADRRRASFTYLRVSSTSKIFLASISFFSRREKISIRKKARPDPKAEAPMARRSPCENPSPAKTTFAMTARTAKTIARPTKTMVASVTRRFIKHLLSYLVVDYVPILLMHTILGSRSGLNSVEQALNMLTMLFRVVCFVGHRLSEHSRNAVDSPPEIVMDL